MIKNIWLILFVALLASGCGQDDSGDSGVRRARRPATNEVPAATTNAVTIPTNCVDLVLTVDCQPCTLGQPISVTFMIANTTSVNQQAGGIPPDAASDPAITMSLEDESGKPVPMLTKGGGVFTGVVTAVELPPGVSQSYPHPTDLLQVFEVRQKGVYTLRASRQFPLHGLTNLCTAVAAPVRIPIRNSIEIIKGIRKEVSPVD